MSVTSNAVQMDLGKKNVVSDDLLLGAAGTFVDRNMDNPNAMGRNSCNTIRALYVKNSTGSALGSGKGVLFKSGKLGKEVNGYHSANGRCDGVVDPFLGAGVTVADGDYFWLIIAGPIDIEVGAGDLTVNSVVQTLTGGRFGTGTAGTNPIGHSGVSDEAGVEDGRARVFFRSSFAAAVAPW